MGAKGGRAPLAPRDKFLRRISKLTAARDWVAVERECLAHKDANGKAPEAPFLASIAAYLRQDMVDAVDLAQKSYDMAPATKEFSDWLSVLYTLVGDMANAVFHAKMSSAMAADPDLRKLMPVGLPEFRDIFTHIEEKPLFRRAITASSQNRWSEAENWFRQHLSFHPEHREGYTGLAHCMMLLGHFESAIQNLRSAMHIFPGDGGVASLLGQALFAAGRFAEGRGAHGWAMVQSPDDPLVAASAALDLLHDDGMPPAVIADAFHAWGKRFGHGDSNSRPKGSGDGGRIGIGYVLGGLGRRRHGASLAKILARHDRERFRVVGFGFGHLTDAENIKFQKCFEDWQDVHDTDPVTMGMMVAARNIDILIDLSGFADPELLAAFGSRMAPLQLAWMGTPLGSGLAGFDATLTDRFLDPEGEPSLIDGRPVYLETGAMVLATPLETPPPEDADPSRPLTFAADASMAELTPETLIFWAGILHDHPDAMLLLRDHDFTEPVNTGRLVEIFGNFGLAHRVDIFSQSGDGEFFAQADICLLPAASLRPESVVEALWAGLPIIAKKTNGRHHRQAESLLGCLGLTDRMVGGDVDACRKLVTFWRDGEVRREFGRTIRETIRQSPLFDPDKRVADLENALANLWRQKDA